MLTALIGMMALAVDLGKVWNLETELQHAADACALVAVTQLDGTDGARVRAIQAAIGQLANNQQRGFARDTVDADSDSTPDGLDIKFDRTITIGNVITDVTDNRDIRFYTNLPAVLANYAKSDGDARLAECNVLPRTAPFSFAMVVGGPSSASPGARALAGWETLRCDATPMMMCNPNELDPAPVDGDGNFIQTSFDILTGCPSAQLGPGAPLADPNSCIGRGITMKEHTGGGHLYPGEWGYLEMEVYDPGTDSYDTLKGAMEIAEALAEVDPGAVCRGNTVTTRPGTVASIGRFMNMRFDIYPKDEYRGDPDYQPAVNVAKGLVPRDALWDPAIDQCRFSTTSPADPGLNDWRRPDNPYDGPGMHMPGGTTDFDPVTGNPIDALSYPRDACAFALVDTNETDFDLHYGAGSLDGKATCVFVPRPGDNITPVGNQIGTGQWDIDTYLAKYHPDIIDLTAVPSEGDLDGEQILLNPPYNIDRPTIDLESGGVIEVANGRISRWEIYLWQMNFDWTGFGLPGYTPAGASYPDNMPDGGLARCHQPLRDYGVDPLPDYPALNNYDRRIIVMAVVNCGTVTGGGKKTLPLAPGDGRIGVFLTEPMGEVNPDAIYGEIVDPRGIGGADAYGPILPNRERLVLIE